MHATAAARLRIAVVQIGGVEWLAGIADVVGEYASSGDEFGEVAMVQGSTRDVEELPDAEGQQALVRWLDVE